MKRMTKSMVTLVIIMSFMLTSFAGGWDVSQSSGWAKEGLEEAFAHNLMPEGFESNDYTKKITRAEFATSVVMLYESLTGEVVAPAARSTFSDVHVSANYNGAEHYDNDYTEYYHYYVLKANTIGIMLGSNGKANPEGLVTREGMAAMYYRTLQKIYEFYGQTLTKTDGILTFSDKALVHNWAGFYEAVDYINTNGIMTGSGGKFNPLGDATREQAIIVSGRIYNDELDLVQEDALLVNAIHNDGAGNISVDFASSQTTKLIVSSVESGIRSPNLIYYGKKAIASYDFSKIFFLCTQNLDFVHPDSLCVYNSINDSYMQIGSMSTNVEDFTLYNYDGMELVILDTGKTAKEVYNYNGTFITNQVFSLDASAIHMNLDNYYEKNKFMIVWNGVSVATTTTGIVWPDYEGQRPVLTYDNFVYLKKDVQGPAVVTGDMYSSMYDLTDYYTQNAVYECDMNVLTDTGVTQNAGIMFNVQDLRNGNVQFQGYTVTVDISNDTLNFGKCFYDWQFIQAFPLPTNMTVYDRFVLKVVRNGAATAAYINDIYVGAIIDNTYMTAGSMGFYAWNSDAAFYKLTAYPYE